MNPGQKQSELTFEKVLEKFGAKRAFDTLVTKELDQKLLKYWLRYIAIASGKYGKRSENKRRATQLADSARRLANKIERSAESPPLLFTGRATELNAMLALQRELPDHLRDYAAAWEKLVSWRNRLSKSRPRGPQNPRTDRIAALLEIVKQLTGAYHYPEVADLLNLMDRAYKRKGSTKWDEQNLAQLQYRARKRTAKTTRKG